MQSFHSPQAAALAEALNSRFGQRLRRDEPLAPHTTLRVGGPADLWLAPATLDELIEAVMAARQHQVPVFLLGGGANLLISDRGVRGVVLQNRCQRIVLGSQDPPHVIVESGVILPSLARRLARRGLSGLEWAVGVPGTVGGAVVNNAGAHGTSMAASLVRAELLMPSGQREWHPAGWFAYEYRSSRLKHLDREDRGWFVVLQAELALSNKAPSEIEDQMAIYAELRKATQPPGASVGSMFKNPPDDFAGRLIEAAGLKQTQIGAAQISPVHANFFVNLGGAQAADFAALLDLARRTVQDKFGVELELEVEKVGEWANADSTDSTE
jgi:UDP-N-acetylmuramate dehydrogenase